MKNLQFYIFGSKSSVDLDLILIVDKLGNIQENKKIVKEYEESLQEQFNFTKELNVNLAVIKDNIITEVFKGTIDEVNNSIIDTYYNHKQHYPLLISKRIERDVDLKVLRCLRILLSFLSRTQHRVEIKKALKSDALAKYNLLKELDLSIITDLNKDSISMKDYYKTVAFQLGQTYSLIQGKELYSKESIGNEYIELKPFLSRSSEVELNVLNKFKEKFLSSLDTNKLKDAYEVLKK